MKLTKPQQQLYDAMKRGVVCHYGQMQRTQSSTYYFRNDTYKLVTAAARRLLGLGLAEKFNTTPYGTRHSLRVKTK